MSTWFRLGAGELERRWCRSDLDGVAPIYAARREARRTKRVAFLPMQAQWIVAGVGVPLKRHRGSPVRRPAARRTRLLSASTRTLKVVAARDKGELAVEEMEAAVRALNEETEASEVGHPTSASADCNRIGALVALSSPSAACTRGRVAALVTERRGGIVEVSGGLAR